MVNASEVSSNGSFENPIYALSAQLEADGHNVSVRKVTTNGIFFSKVKSAQGKGKERAVSGSDADDSGSPLRSALSAPLRKAKEAMLGSPAPSASSNGSNGLVVEPEELEEKPPDEASQAVIVEGQAVERIATSTIVSDASHICESPIDGVSAAPNGLAITGAHTSPRLVPLTTDLLPIRSSQSPDGFLAPPSPLSPGSRSPALTNMRRSQTVSASPVSVQGPASPVLSSGSPRATSPQRLRGPQRTMSLGPHLELSDGETPEAQFDDNVAKQADAIRRERAEKRLEKEKIEEKEMREKTRPRAGTPLADKALKGNIIGEDHVNYVLMYNMLTGIRIGVSRCQAKPKRDLTDEDFTAKHKFSFDIIGNELTPSAKYDFKFKDYAPWVFRDLREHFYLDPADYLVSLTAKYILSELGSPGKSGSFFYFSRDYRFIIKTIAHSEHKFLRAILRDYHTHVKSNPHTLVSRFYGLHRVKLPRGRKIHFVIMNNLFPPHRDIHETYDLKGSSQGREYPEEKAKDNPGAVLKDLNWVRRHKVFELGPEKKALFEEQLRRDVELLQRLRIMDYSLLVGVHDMTRGNKDNLREHGLTTFQPEPGKMRRRTTQQRRDDAMALRQAVQSSDPQALSNTNRLPDRDRSERKHFIFYQDEGGMRATGDDNEAMQQIYYLGIIDILTPYTLYKWFEHFGKSFKHDGDTISAVPPAQYGSRFLRFICHSVRGGDLSKRPKME